jgi:hypothetical protein
LIRLHQAFLKMRKAADTSSSGLLFNGLIAGSVSELIYRRDRSKPKADSFTTDEHG